MRRLVIAHLLPLLFGLILNQAAGAPSEPIGSQVNNEPQDSMNTFKSALSSSDIVISSLDEGLLASNQGQRERHLYENQEDAKSLNGTKPEPRNQQEDQQANSASAQDPLILDHRPTGGEQGSDFTQQTTTQPPTSQVATGQVAYNSIVVNSTGGQPYQSASWFPQTGSAGQPAVQQQQIPHHTSGFHQQQVSPLTPQTGQPSTQPGAQPQVVSYGNAAAASNQVMSVQHPSAVNTITDHQQASTMTQMAVSAPTGGQQVGTASAQQGQLVSVNGQPVLLMNGQNSLGGGRRISISGWLKGLSSMLANIFNRRDHGALAGQASSPMGHWIQLGPNAPHWLTQAQNLIQQQQQQFQQQFNPQPLASASTNRYTTYVQAPQAIQLQPTAMQTGGSSMMAQQQHPLAVPSNNNYQTGQSANINNDLQASGSSVSYVAVQAPSQVSQTAQYPSALQVPSAPVRAPANLDQVRNQNQVNQQQHTAAPSQQSQVRQNRSSSSSTNTASQNLPLAHYSRYGVAVD